jgi:hypothetical protein
VDWAATVWVNGKKLGAHRGGYDGFDFDVTDALKVGAEQELVVGVWDPTDRGTQPRGKQVLHPGGIMYTPTTGIWQTVWLEPVPEAFIEGLTITPDVDRKLVRVQTHLHGAGDRHRIRISALWDRTDAGAAYGHESNMETNAIFDPQNVKLREIKLWSPDSPFLYDLRVQLLDGNRVVDEVWSYFGMRKIAVGRDHKGITRLLLNGAPCFMLGPLDQGFWPDGTYTAPTDEALRYDIEMMKKLGFNMARKHVKVEPERWYYWCDKLGLLVWQDMPSGDRGVAPGKGEIERSAESARDFERELNAMIDGRRNHPSIVQWVVFNEGWGQFDTARLTRWVKELDPTRLADCASGWNDMGVGDVHDIHVYPGPGSPDAEPARAAVLGEFGGLGLGIEGHSWSNKTWGYLGTRDSAELTRKYERLLARVWELKDKPGLCAAVYTQITDVETEGNGLMTYDRAILKLDAERASAVNGGDLSRVPQLTEVVPTSREKPQTWRYTALRPAEGWYRPGFDDASWKEGPGGFGTKGTPGAVVRTTWDTADIWLRREFTLPEKLPRSLELLLHHDEDAEVYVNGVLAAKVRGFVTEYVDVPIRDEARAALRPGKNTVAVHCHQTTGGQYIDVGLAALREKGR